MLSTYILIVPITHVEVSIQLDSRSSSREYTDIMMLTDNDKPNLYYDNA